MWLDFRQEYQDILATDHLQWHDMHLSLLVLPLLPPTAKEEDEMKRGRL
jgi:hypothetical protein